jgi:hypothetical protein
VQVDEQHSTAKPAPLPSHVPGLHGQGGLTDSGQPGHRRHHHWRGRTSWVQQSGQYRQLIIPASEPGRRCGQLSQRCRHRGRRVGAAQPGQRLPDLVGELAEHVFDPLALQVGHVIVQLGRQRKQRPAAGPARDDLPQQVTCHFLRHQRARHP